MSSAQLMHHLATYVGSFLIMIVFIVIAIINAKKKTAWIWYAIGSAFQLLSLLGNQKNSFYTWENLTVDWIIYFVLLIGAAILVATRYNSKETRNTNLGCKWFIFYSRVRPFLAVFFFIPWAIDFFKYTDVYLSNFWFMLLLVGLVTQIVLCIMVFKKSFGNYTDFVRFMYGVLFFEAINIPYQQAVMSYIRYGYDFIFCFITFVMILIPAYFLWYRLNIKYFEKRISHLTNNTLQKKSRTKTNPAEPYKSRFTECPKCGYIAVFEKECPQCGFVLPTEVQENNSSEIPKILFCRKCGAKLLEDAKFCKECGTEIITKVEGTTNAL